MLLLGLGILCGMIIQTILIFIYACMKASSIDKDKKM